MATRAATSADSRRRDHSVARKALVVDTGVAAGYGAACTIDHVDGSVSTASTVRAASNVVMDSNCPV